MERKYLIVLVLLGIIASLYAAITYQWVLMVLVVAMVVLILSAFDVAQWFRSQSEGARSACEVSRTGLKDLEESVESIKHSIEKIERRLSDLEKR